jgi:putative membrane protein
LPIHTKKNIAVFIALLFHVSGFIGMAFTQHKNWFVQSTALNLIIMFGLLVWVQPQKTKWFYVFFSICFLVGVGVEIIGVNTSLLFGNYTYGNVLGLKILGVPLLIGVQWFVTIFCSASIIQQIQVWVENRVTKETGNAVNFNNYKTIQYLSLVIDGALIATFFDFVLEPVAQKLEYWTWANYKIPSYNYICWFIVSALLLFVYKLLPFKKINQFALHLFIIQVLFFLALRIYL